MKVTARAFRLAASVTTLLALASSPASADLTKDACADANGKGQQLRRELKLAAARIELRTCASASCPAIVRDDCARRLDELDKAQPSIVFEVRDAAGSDVSAVKVTVDDSPLTERLDGAAIPVDIGAHVFRFEVAEYPPVVRTLIIAEGEKARHEIIVISAATSPARAVTNPAMPLGPSASRDANATVVSGAASSANETASGPGRMGARKTLGLVAGGTGVAAAAVGAGFAGIASSQWATARRECPSHSECSQQAISERNDALRSANVATVTFIAGGILLATGVTLLLTAPKSNYATVGLRVAPGGVGLVGNF